MFIARKAALGVRNLFRVALFCATVLPGALAADDEIKLSGQLDFTIFGKNGAPERSYQTETQVSVSPAKVAFKVLAQDRFKNWELFQISDFKYTYSSQRFVDRTGSGQKTNAFADFSATPLAIEADGWTAADVLTIALNITAAKGRLKEASELPAEFVPPFVLKRCAEDDIKLTHPIAIKDIDGGGKEILFIGSSSSVARQLVGRIKLVQEPVGYPRSVLFENYGPPRAGDDKPELYSRYAFSLEPRANGQDSLLTGKIAYDDSQAVGVSDQRIDPQRPIEYTLEPGNDVPFDLRNSKVVSIATAKAKLQQSTQAAVDQKNTAIRIVIIASMAAVFGVGGYYLTRKTK